MQKFNTVQQTERQVIRNRNDSMSNDKLMINVINTKEDQYNNKKIVKKQVDSDNIFDNLIIKNDSKDETKTKSKKHVE